MPIHIYRQLSFSKWLGAWQKLPGSGVLRRLLTFDTRFRGGQPCRGGPPCSPARSLLEDKIPDPFLFTLVSLEGS